MKDGQTIGQWLKWDFETDGDFEIHDKRGNLLYFEDEKRYRSKWEYDSQGKVIYMKDSDGKIVDNRPKPSPELTLESLAEQVLKLNEIVTKFVNKP